MTKQNDSWFKVAKEDLKSAEILYDHKLYLQALYFLQQSAEKTQKAYFLADKSISKGQEIGHSLIKGITKHWEKKLVSKVRESVRKRGYDDKKAPDEVFNEVIKKDKKVHAYGSQVNYFRQISIKKDSLKKEFAKNPSNLEKHFSLIVKLFQELNIFNKQLKKAMIEFNSLVQNSEKEDINKITYLLDRVCYVAGHVMGCLAAYMTLLEILLPNQSELRYPSNSLENVELITEKFKMFSVYLNDLIENAELLIYVRSEIKDLDLLFSKKIKFSKKFIE